MRVTYLPRFQKFAVSILGVIVDMPTTQPELPPEQEFADIKFPQYIAKVGEPVPSAGA